MTDMPEIMQMAQQLARHAGTRQAIIARNVANADTPGYRAQDLGNFADTYRKGGTLALRTTRPGHIGAADTAFTARVRNVEGPTSPNGNSVSLEEEMLRGASTLRDHDLALAVYRSAIGILRTSLGRAR